MITMKIIGAEVALLKLATKLNGVDREAAEVVAKLLRQCAIATRTLEALPLPITEPVEH